MRRDPPRFGRWLCLIGLSNGLFAGSAAADPEFVALDAPDHHYTGGWEHFVGGGTAVFDCDGDDIPEIFAAGGSGPSALLHRDDNGHAYAAVQNASLALSGVTGAYPLDINNDGLTDLAILRVGPDLLMQGLGNCAFAPFTDLGFTSGDYWTTAFSATWEAGQTLPTLAFGTYVDRNDPDGPFETCDDTLLYRPNGTTYGPPLRLKPGFCALSMLFSDWNRDGRADLRISNDRHYYVRGGQEQLWAMEAAPRLYSDTDGWQPYAIWGMGIASRDVTGDGFPEVYLTSMGDQKLQIFDPAPGGPVWRDATYARGTTAHRPHVGGDGRPSTGWHAQFGDVNNDGRDDIFIAKGNVQQMPDAAMRDPNSLLLQLPDGRFAEASLAAGVASMERSRGAALSDLDLDGWLDLVVVNRGAAIEVYRNTGGAGNWLLAEVTQDGVNTQAVGAFIELRTPAGTQTREITVGGGHAGGQAGMQHFGLGAAQMAELRVIWPDGTVGAWQDVSANTRVDIQRSPDVALPIDR